VSVHEYRVDTKKQVDWSTPTEYSLTHSLLVQHVCYSSKDGTEIPMCLVMRNELTPIRVRPVILTGYGGFGTSMTPRFSVLVTMMLDLGAIFAMPSIRGGSEFGRAWHEAARARRRQVAFDDFISAAEWLCAEGITTPHMLAIFGASNSGLLVAAVMTQRPELFCAVLCIAPLLDMIRYEHFNLARKWRCEYGSTEDAEDFHALYAYSPYHRVRENVNYPSTLFVSGDMDERCNPAHARKMTAVLQDRKSQVNPILLDYSGQRGHLPVLPLSVRIEALERRIAFLCRQLGIRIPSDGVQ
jgi:prolyl oligopeptidase